VSAPSKGRSIYDELTTAIVGASRIKACRIVAAYLHCNISAEWIPRRSNRQSVVADDLTHNLTASLTKEELSAYLEGCMVEFPPPMAQWMANPIEDKTLGRKCVLWAIATYPSLAANP